MDENTMSLGQGDEPRLVAKGQYIKDFSFENPHAPGSLLGDPKRPNIDLNIDMNVGKLDDSHYELVIKISARAVAEKSTLFLIDLDYAGIFELDNIPEEHMENVLLVDCAFLLFPFARQVVADITRDGGFPPLMLEPTDFALVLFSASAGRESQ